MQERRIVKHKILASELIEVRRNWKSNYLKYLVTINQLRTRLIIIFIYTRLSPMIDERLEFFLQLQKKLRG